MTIFEIIKCIFLAVLTVLLGLMALITHRIGTIRKWEIEKNEKPGSNQNSMMNTHEEGNR